MVTARLKYIVENEWDRRRYLDVSLLEEKKVRAQSDNAGGPTQASTDFRKILDGTAGRQRPTR